MAGITSMGTTFNLPNYVGELFSVSPEDTPFLSAIGGLTGGVAVNSVLFTWSTYDLRDADSTRQRLEGADAPTPEGRARQAAFNVLEIHQEQVQVSYTKQAATNQFASPASTKFVGGSNAVTDELGWQLMQEFKQIARDVEKSFIVGQYAFPGDNSDPRKTRGLIEAIDSNEVDLEDAPLTEEDVLDLMQLAWENGGIQESETRTLMCGATVKRRLTKLFIKDANYQEQTRNVGGVHLQTIETDFGRTNIMLNRYMPADTLVVVSLEECSPRFLEIPGKGHFFAEPLAKTGASEKVQIYGEIGLAYGNELKHGKIVNIGAGGS